MNSLELINRVVGGLSVEQALSAFVAACRRQDTLFITEKWFAPRAERLRTQLSEPITDNEAHVLRLLIWQKVSFDEAFEWLDHKQMSLEEYQTRKKTESECARNRLMEVGLVPWPDVEAWRRDSAMQEKAQREHPRCRVGSCPRCQIPLTWIYFSSPNWLLVSVFGEAVWLGLCDACHLQVDFEIVYSQGCAETGQRSPV